MKTTRTIRLLIFALLASYPLFAQVSVTGPDCVIPGLIYQYNISGNWDSAATMSVCITGGVLSENNASCTPNGAPLPFIRVLWNENTPLGKITLRSSKGIATVSVSITTVLQPGSIDKSFRTQTVSANLVPSGITCAAPSGGGCSIAYQYQWQQSNDQVNWSNIPGATSKDLIFSNVAQQTGYYRRKTIHTVSGNIEYSDIAAVAVNPSPQSN